MEISKTQLDLKHAIEQRDKLKTVAPVVEPKHDYEFWKNEANRLERLSIEEKKLARRDLWQSENDIAQEAALAYFGPRIEQDEAFITELIKRRTVAPPNGMGNTPDQGLMLHLRSLQHLKRALGLGAERSARNTPPPAVETFEMICHGKFERMQLGLRCPLGDYSDGQHVSLTEPQVEFAYGCFRPDGSHKFTFVGANASRNERRFRKFGNPPKSVNVAKRLDELNEGVANFDGEESGPGPRTTLDGRPSRTGWLNKITGRTQG